MRLMDIQPSPKDRRVDLNLSQQELATLLGVTQATVSRNETAAEPDRRYMLALEGLSARKDAGEDLAATAANLATKATPDTAKAA